MSRVRVLLSVLIFSIFVSSSVGENGSEKSQMSQNDTNGLDDLKALFGNDFKNTNGIYTQSL